MFGVMLFVGLGVAAYGWHTYERYSEDLPTLDSLRNYQPRVMSRMYAGDDRLIAELATERRIFMPVTAIPDIVKNAFISAEDQKFWTHKGVDPLAIIRAGLTDVMNYGQGRRPIGASTITQQVAKNMLLGNEVSVSRKIKEMILALRIDQSLSKDKVLELYLNEIYLGLQSYGVAAAAQAYFNKSLDELTIPEAAFLAALPKAPNNYNPFRFPEAAKARRDWVLDRMAETHAITADQAAQAKATPIVPAAFRRPETVPGSEWFAEEVRRQMVDRFGADATTQGGYIIRTSLDPTLQAAADSALRKGLMAYDRSRGGWRGPVTHLDPAPMRQGWNTALAALPRPPGMLTDWRLAVVLDATAEEAKVGWLDRSIGQNGNGPSAGGQASPAQKTGMIYMSDTTWARPVRATGLGPTPRRMSEVLQAGDVVMVEPQAATPEPPKPGAGKVALRETVARPDRVVLRQIPVVQGAIVSLDPVTGRVLAMSGGWSADGSQFNRATQAQRQPGSSFKPMVYLTAMEAGLSPTQRVLDAPFVENLGAQGQWRPQNDDLSFSGPVPLRIALERSLNLVTVRLADKLGMDSIAQNAIAFHVVDSMPKVLPAALGAVETTVLRQASAYAGLAMGGREVLPSLVDSVQNSEGQVIWHATGISCQGCSDPSKPPMLIDNRRQIADPQSTFQVVQMMQGVVRSPGGTGTGLANGFPQVIAGKTGTSQDFNDAWFVGFTADLVTAVWIGKDDNTSLGDKEFGATVAGPVWHDFMAVALKNRPVLQFRVPEGIKLSTWDGGGNRIDAFKPDQVPGGSQGVIGGGETSPDDVASSAAGAGPGVGIDSGMGGLY
jgi:penicillin-binding protein 1A